MPTQNLLRTLLRSDLVRVFERVARCVREGDLAIDPLDIQIIDEAHVLRIEIVLRWAKAGANQNERQLAVQVDRLLDSYREALLAVDESDYVGDWLGDLWVDHDVDIDRHTWWGFQLDQDAAFLERCDQALVELSVNPPAANRHESSWERTDPLTWREVRFERFTEDNDLLTEMGDDRDHELDEYYPV